MDVEPGKRDLRGQDRGPARRPDDGKRGHSPRSTLQNVVTFVVIVLTARYFSDRFDSFWIGMVVITAGYLLVWLVEVIRTRRRDRRGDASIAVTPEGDGREGI